MVSPSDDGGSPVKRDSTTTDHLHHDDDLPFPELLRDSDPSDNDGNDDAPSQGPPLYMNMNQSIFGLIAAAGAKVDFTDRFNDSSSDDDADDDDDQDASSSGNADDDDDNRDSSGRLRPNRTEDLSQTMILSPPRPQTQKKSKREALGRNHKLLRSLPVLPKLKGRSRGSKLSTPPTLSTPQELPEPNDPSDAESPATTAHAIRDDEDRLPPVMSRMLEARAQISNRPSLDLERSDAGVSAGAQGGPSQLAKKLMEIFAFEEPEEVIEEYPCWLLQSVLLQGFMYITSRHICFYAYLPKKSVSFPACSGWLVFSLACSIQLADSEPLDRSVQIRFPLQDGQEESQVHALLVPPKGRRALLLPRRQEPVLPPWSD